MTTSRILAKIKLAQRVAIFGHINPDPDAYGAMFAMRELCRQVGVEAEIFAIKNKDCYLDFLFPLNELKTDFKAENFDLVILLDLHLLSRVDSLFAVELSNHKNIIVIDHHKVMDGDVLPTKSTLIKDDYAATCEVLTGFAVENNLKITPQTATYLYTGLMGDTDRFLHNNLTTHVFETAITLFKSKANVQFIYNYLYRYKTPEQLRINKFLLDNMVFTAKDRALYVIFGLDDLKKLNADQESVKVFTNDLVNVKGVEVSFMCIEYKKDFFKFSLRAKNGINTVNFAKKMGGGGHVCASAFEMKISRNKLQKILPKWAKEILNGK